MPYKNETSRIRNAYARRDLAGKPHLYNWTQPDVLQAHYSKLSAIVGLLRAAGWTDLSGKDCLDVGCGSGGWLRTLQEWGAAPGRLHGVDLMQNRIDIACARSPHIDFRVSEGWPLPFPDASMDMVSAHTVFSSILESGARSALAQEIKRLLRPGGIVLLYDFRISNPRNPDTTGISPAEVRRLFAGTSIRAQSVTLAPPVARQLSKLSPHLACAVESCFPFLRTHAVFLITI
jgi:ubiquinone/menaquinone biosynthesis C-methylase UbiE